MAGDCTMIVPGNHFVGQEKLNFSDISTEEWREYIYPTPYGLTGIRIENPHWLNVKRKPEGDSHRIISKDGLAHYVPSGFVHIHWKSKPGAVSETTSPITVNPDLSAGNAKAIILEETTDNNDQA